MTATYREDLLRARNHAAAVAGALEAPPEPLERLFFDLLRATGPLTVADIVSRSADHACLPGWQAVFSPTPLLAADWCEFIADAALRARAARDRGVPAIPIFTLRKTGSSFATEYLKEGLNIAMGVVSIDYQSALPAWLSFALRFPVSLHDHLPPLPGNLELLEKLPASRVVIHVRDPRQMIVSLAHHALLHNSRADPLVSIYRNCGFISLVDRLITEGAPDYAAWLNGWKTGARRLRLRLLVTTYEAMVRDRETFFYDILDFFQAPASVHAGIARALASKKRPRPGYAMFRKGTTDEWKQVLLPRQIRAIERLCAGAFVDLYGF